MTNFKTLCPQRHFLHYYIYYLKTEKWSFPYHISSYQPFFNRVIFCLPRQNQNIDDNNSTILSYSVYLYEKPKIRFFISDALHLPEAYPSSRGVRMIGICCKGADLCFNFTTKITTNPNVIFSFWFCGVMRTYTFHMITPLAPITHQKLRIKQSESVCWNDLII